MNDEIRERMNRGDLRVMCRNDLWFVKRNTDLFVLHEAYARVLQEHDKPATRRLKVAE
jgi:hypothetical protein